jgi:hypothetical protein
MDLEKIRNQIESIITDFEKVYEPDELSVIKFKFRYSQLLRELDFNLAVFGTAKIIEYLNTWSNKERFGKLEYYTKMLANGGDSRKELFFLYATEKINSAFISFLRSIPKGEKVFPNLNYNKVMFELQRSIEIQNSIPQQLEVWKIFFNEQIEDKIEIPEMFKESPVGRVAYLHKFERDVESLCREIFPESNKFYTSILIPDKLFQFNFEFVQDDPEFTFWFLKYNAKRHFETYIMSDIYDDMESPLWEEHVTGYLNDLKVEEQNVKDLVSTHQIHSSKDNPEFTRQTELLRILEGYYKTNPLQDIFSTNNIIVDQYARHVFLKKYLKSIRTKPGAKVVKQLIDHFLSPSHFKVVMDLLIKEGKCQSGTFVWLDRAAGYKTHIAYLFRILHSKGYFPKDHSLSIEEKVELALNFFGVKIGKQTFKNASSPPGNLYDFIPDCMDLPDLDN